MTLRSRLHLAAVMALLAVSAGAEEKQAKGRAKALEGDLLEVGGKKIRLHAIDAPDKGQKCQNRRGVEYDCFEVAKTALTRLTETGDVTCDLKGQPTDNPRQGVCRLEDGRDVAAIMVRAGWALAYRRIADDYSGFEATAASWRSGMWGGRVEPPWLWRSRQQEREADALGAGTPASARK